jgi:hypothetical protein
MTAPHMVFEQSFQVATDPALLPACPRKIREERWPHILEYCSFPWMKKNGNKVVPLEGLFWDGGSEVFVHRGHNGRWRTTLTQPEAAEYETAAIRELGMTCAQWLATGKPWLPRSHRVLPGL